MAGLIADTLDNGTKAYGAGTTDYDPTLRTVDPAKETVAGQLNTILGSGSPVLERAKTGAMQTANKRGLLNSSMAAGAGEAAMIDAALPIANADANVFGTAARDNQQFSNASGQFNAGAKNVSDLNLSNAANTSQLSTQQTGQQKELAQQAADIQTGQILPATIAGQKELATQSGEIQTALQTLKGTQATDLAEIEANYKTLIQTSASAADLYKSTLAGIANIFADTTIPAAGKAAVVNGYLGWLKQSLNLTGSVNGVDLTGLTDFGTVAA